MSYFKYDIFDKLKLRINKWDLRIYVQRSCVFDKRLGISNLGSAPVSDSDRIRPASLWRNGLAYGRAVGVREGIYLVNYMISDLPVTLDVSSRMSVPWQTDWVAFHIMDAINSNRLLAFHKIVQSPFEITIEQFMSFNLW